MTLISELLPEFYDLAILRQSQNKDSQFSKTTNELGNAFRWSDTPEGYGFWSRVDNDEYTCDDSLYALDLTNSLNFQPLIF